MMDLDKGYFINKDGEIDEEEYDSWYKIFVIPWLVCDADKDNFLLPAEIKPCLETPELKILSTINEADYPKLLSFLD